LGSACLARCACIQQLGCEELENFIALGHCPASLGQHRAAGLVVIRRGITS